MLLQSTLSPSSLSSTLSYSHHSLSSSTIQPKFSNLKTFAKKPITFPIIKCSISQIHSYGTTDYEKRPMVTWNIIHKKISMMDNPDLGSATVLNQWQNEGKRISKWELCRVIKELRKYRRFKPALEVYEWMFNKEEKFRISTSDAAIQLDLISKVRGIVSAEAYFNKLPDHFKDKRIYGALLNAYVQARMKEKAESLIDEMRTKGYASHPLPFNVVMTLYMNLREYGKVDSLINEMVEKNILLDIYSYNIWLSCCGYQGLMTKMEDVFEQMKLDKTINPNWTTFSTMATMYTKQGDFAKAEQCLKMVETKISGRDRIPYHYLISLYGGVGNKEEVYRVWNTYKSVFPTIPNLGYHAVISSLIRSDDIEGAEEIYEQWLSVKLNYDPRIGNLLMSCYIKQGSVSKADFFVEHMVQVGGKPNSTTWEILAEGHIGEKNLSEASSCLKKAFAVEERKGWRPKPSIVTSFISLCEEEDDTKNKETLISSITNMGLLEDEKYAALIGLKADVSSNDEETSTKNDENEGYISDELLLNHMQGGL